MAWPLSQDYNEALQNPQSSFSDPDLRQGRVAVNALGIPLPCSGNFADVYAVESAANSGKWAVKCFTRQVHGLRERYSEISKHLQQARLPFTIDFQYLEQGIRIAGQWYPVLKMHWIEGKTLNAFIGEMLDKPDKLEVMSRVWLRMAQRLREAEIAHCDLQHGNVLLVPESGGGAVAVKLIDYDGMWIPSLAQRPSGEIGHPAYQHPQRLRESTYRPEVDHFSLLTVYGALRALMVGGRALWERYDTGDNLLFRQQDFESPTRSPLFAELLRMKEAEVRQAAAALIDAARMPLEKVPHLTDLISGKNTTSSGNCDRTAPPSSTSVAPKDGGKEPIIQRAANGKRTRNVRTWMIATAAAAILAVLAGGMFLTLRRKGLPEKIASAPSPQAPIDRAEPTKDAVRKQSPSTVGKPKLAEEKKPIPPIEKSIALSPRPAEKKPTPTPPSGEKPTAPAPEKKNLSLPAGASIADLRRALKNEDASLRELAAARLAGLGPHAEPALAELTDALSDENNPMRVRRNAALAIARIGPAAKNAAPALGKALQRKQPPEVRQCAAEALALMKYPANEAAVPAIVDAINDDPDPSVRQKCVWSLFDMHSNDQFRACGAEKALRKIVAEDGGKIPFLRYDAARKLAHLLREEAPDQTTDVLLEMLKNKAIKVHKGTEAKIEDAGRMAKDGRTNVQTKIGGDARYMAPQALTWLGKKAGRRKDVLDALQAAAKDPDPQLRKAAAAALESLRAEAKADGPAGKAPPPAKDMQDQLSKEIREIYQSDFKLLLPAERLALAKKLYQRGQDAKEEPDRRFAYLREAGEVAADAADAPLSLRIIDEMSKSYAIEELPMKTEVLARAAKATQSIDAIKEMAGEALTLLSDAEAADNYEPALPLAKLAVKIAQKSGDEGLKAICNQRLNRLNQLKKEFAQLKDAAATLASKPRDPHASRLIGAFRCFDKGKWDQGLPLLAQGDDKILARLAREDLDLPTEAEEQAKLGQRWGEFASKQKTGQTKTAAQRRAHHWLYLALPSLKGSERARVARKLERNIGRLSLRPGLTAELFGDYDLKNRLKTRLDYTIRFNWDHAAPDAGIPADHFSIRWQGWLIPPRPGKYKLSIDHDDGARLSLDGKKIIDNWGNLGNDSVEVVLTTQPHSLLLEYHDFIRQAHIHFTWSQAGVFAERTVPIEVLFHDQEQAKMLRR